MKRERGRLVIDAAMVGCLFAVVVGLGFLERHVNDGLRKQSLETQKVSDRFDEFYAGYNHFLSENSKFVVLLLRRVAINGRTLEELIRILGLGVKDGEGQGGKGKDSDEVLRLESHPVRDASRGLLSTGCFPGSPSVPARDVHGNQGDCVCVERL